MLYTLNACTCLCVLSIPEGNLLSTTSAPFQRVCFRPSRLCQICESSVCDSVLLVYTWYAICPARKFDYKRVKYSREPNPKLEVSEGLEISPLFVSILSRSRQGRCEVRLKWSYRGCDRLPRCRLVAFCSGKRYSCPPQMRLNTR